ncbi:MAG: PQQ-binding-like beta-propeller repeat protein [Candidatus Methanofastidiosia archaeon]
MKAAALILLLCIASTQNDWPLFRHNPEGNSYSGCQLPDTLDIVWKFSLPDGSSGKASRGFSGGVTPSVSDSKIYFVVDGVLHCLDADYGILLFEKRISETEKYSTYTAVEGTRVFVCEDTYLYHDVLEREDYHLLCFDISKKEVIWSVSPGFLTDSVPIAKNGRVYLPVFQDGIAWLWGRFGGYEWDTLVCIDSTGGILWQVSPSEPYIHVIIHAPPVLGDGKIYMVGDRLTYNDILYCLDAENGALLWKKGIHGYQAWVHYYDGAVYCGCSPRIAKIDGENGDVIWEKEIEYSVENYFTIGDGKLFIEVDTDQFSEGCEEMWGLDASTGDRIWRSEILKCTGIPAAADGKVITGSFDGYIYLLDGENGDILQKIYIGEKVCCPVIASGKVFVQTRYCMYALGKKGHPYEVICVITFLCLLLTIRRRHSKQI